MSGIETSPEFYNFNNYRKKFSDYILNALSSSPNNIKTLHNMNVILYLRSMLWDPLPTIRQNAALAVAKLATNSKRLSEEMVRQGIVQGIVRNMEKQTVGCKKASMLAIRSITIYSAKNALKVTEDGTLCAIIICLQDQTPIVKTYGAWALRSICKHYKAVGSRVVDSDVIVYAALCLRDTNECLVLFITSSLASLSKHSLKASEAIVNAGCLGTVATNIHHPDIKLQIVSFYLVVNIAMHSLTLVDCIMGPNLLLDIVTFLKHDKCQMKKNAAALFRVICENNGALKVALINKEVVEPLLCALKTSTSLAYIHIIFCLGYLASSSKQYAVEIIHHKGHYTLTIILHANRCQLTTIATIWALTQIGKHSSTLANVLANTMDIFPRIVELYTDQRSSKELKDTCDEALKILVPLCTERGVLRHYLSIAPTELLKYCLEYFVKILALNSKERRGFLLAGGLGKIQLIDAKPSSVEYSQIGVIKLCFPEDMVRYFAPGHFEDLVLTLDTFKPKTKKERRYSRPSRPPHRILSLGTELELFAQYGFIPQNYPTADKSREETSSK